MIWSLAKCRWEVSGTLGNYCPEKGDRLRELPYIALRVLLRRIITQ